MSDPNYAERARRLEEQHVGLRRQMAEIAASIAATEDQIANTFEKMAQQRSASDAEHLLAQAEKARSYAVKERGRAADYGDDD